MLRLHRRGFLAGTSAVIAAPVPMRAGRAGLHVAALKTEYVECPLGIEVAVPRFSWQLAAARRNVRQSAYRILAASAENLLKPGKADLWDSGRIESDRCFEVPYGGRKLSSGQRVFWRVRVWDDKGREASAASWFEMGLLDPADWQGEWLAAEDALEAADRSAGIHWIWADTPLDAKPVQFRYRFELPASPKRAELLVSAKDDLLGVWVNGRSVTLPKTLFWGTMCALPLTLKRGSNILCIEASALTGGFLPPDGGALAAMLRIEAADGTVARWTTGPDWRAVNRAAKGWEEPSFDDGDWPFAVAAKARAKCEPLPSYPARLMRRSFKVEKPVARARLYATALGVYEAFVNGRNAGDAKLAPEISMAIDHVFYQTYDVTSLVRTGSNAIGFHVGDGWYAGAFAWRHEHYALGDGPKRLLAQLVIDYQDGSRDIVATDGAWRSHASPVLASGIYSGESYDARRELPGWNSGDFDDKGWEKVANGGKPHTRLVSQLSPPIRPMKTLEAIGIKEVVPGTFVFDFGQNFSGWGRLRVKGPAGTTVTLRYAEILKPTGEVDQSNLRGAAATDSYVLRGDGESEVYEPKFTYHGFRYVEVGGFPGRLDAEALKGIVAHSAAAETGLFLPANMLVQHIWSNALWSQRSNFFGVPTDCPQRDERMGWMGDIQVFLDAAAFNMDVDAFIRRFLEEVRAGQTADGAYPVVTPQPRSFAPMLTAGWSEAGLILPWTLYRRYGDTRTIADNWAAMSKWMTFLAEANPDCVWRNKRGIDLGDWLSVDAVQPADETTPRVLVATAYWAYSAALMTEMAEAVGRRQEALAYAELRRNISRAFAAEFVKDDGSVGNGSQTSHVLALHFGLVPENLRPAAAAKLAADTRRRGMRLSTGFLGTPYLLDVLDDNGQREVAISLLLQTEYPSWGYMVRKGATTMWERWNSDVGDVAMNSYNHYAFGAVVGFMYRRLGGISAAAPGFRRIVVDPIFDSRIGNVRAEYESVLGRIATEIRGNGDRLTTLRVVVPPNAVAEVHLPSLAWREGKASVHGRKETGRDGMPGLVVEIGSGEYEFRAV